MDEHPGARLIRLALETIDRGDFEALVGMIADEVVWHEIGNPVPILGKPALRGHFAAGGADVPVSVSIHDVVANDDHVIALLFSQATRAGRTISYRTSEIYHLRDGLIAQRWAFSDDTAAIIAFFD